MCLNKSLKPESISSSNKEDLLVVPGKDCANLTANAVVFDAAIKNIDDLLYNYNQPVLTGVHYIVASEYCSGNTPKTVNHWVLIVGKNKDEEGTYYYFYDPGQTNPFMGSSKTNILRVVENEHKLSGAVSDIKTYVVASIRPNSEIIKVSSK